MEAAAIGRPLITTNLPGLREMVKDNVNGFLIEPKSVDSLVSAIVRYLKLSQDKRKKMGYMSYVLAKEKFDVQNVYDIYDKAINNIRSS